MIVSVRKLVADQIKLDNPDFVVKAFPANAPENAGRKIFVHVYRDALNYSNTGLAHELNVDVVVNKQMDEAAQDQADAALDAVLLSLQRVEHIHWTRADLNIFDEKWLGYKIAGSSSSQDIYKSAILSERA